MEQERDDNEELELSNLSGTKLYHLGMNLPQDHWLTVEYSDLKKARSAVTGCGNKCRAEGTSEDFVVSRWENEAGKVCVTVTKKKKTNVLKLPQLYSCIKNNAESVAHQTEELMKRGEGFDYEAFFGETEAARAEKLEATTVAVAVTPIQRAIVYDTPLPATFEECIKDAGMMHRIWDRVKAGTAADDKEIRIDLPTPLIKRLMLYSMSETYQKSIEKKPLAPLTVEVEEAVEFTDAEKVKMLELRAADKEFHIIAAEIGYPVEPVQNYFSLLDAQEEV